MLFHRVPGDVEGLPDLRVAAALPHQGHDLPLPGRQLIALRQKVQPLLLRHPGGGLRRDFRRPEIGLPKLPPEGEDQRGGVQQQHAGEEGHHPLVIVPAQDDVAPLRHVQVQQKLAEVPPELQRHAEHGVDLPLRRGVRAQGVDAQGGEHRRRGQEAQHRATPPQPPDDAVPHLVVGPLEEDRHRQRRRQGHDGRPLSGFQPAPGPLRRLPQQLPVEPQPAQGQQRPEEVVRQPPEERDLRFLGHGVLIVKAQIEKDQQEDGEGEVPGRLIEPPLPFFPLGQQQEDQPHAEHGERHQHEIDPKHQFPTHGCLPSPLDRASPGSAPGFFSASPRRGMGKRSLFSRKKDRRIYPCKFPCRSASW